VAAVAEGGDGGRAFILVDMMLASVGINIFAYQYKL
jgi:hypothetical protein